MSRFYVYVCENPKNEYFHFQLLGLVYRLFSYFSTFFQNTCCITANLSITADSDRTTVNTGPLVCSMQAIQCVCVLLHLLVLIATFIDKTSENVFTFSDHFVFCTLFCKCCVLSCVD